MMGRMGMDNMGMGMPGNLSLGGAPAFGAKSPFVDIEEVSTAGEWNEWYNEKQRFHGS